MKTHNFFYDRLYGRVNLTADDQRLLETPQLSRLASVSLSAIPPSVLKCGTCASKLEHSFGTGHLSRLVCEQPEFKDDELNIYLANLAHDVGTPPMSHLSERFLQLLHGLTHEEFAKEFIFETELGSEMERQGGNLDKIYGYIIGQTEPWSDLVNGSIDLDNLDNSLRFALSMGLINRISYDPESLARAFRFDRQSAVIYLDESCLVDLRGWEETRIQAYNFVYSEHNIAVGSMLNRALALASRVDEIPRTFFKMTDYEALEFMATECNLGTKMLVQEARHFQHHHLLYSLVTEAPTPMVKWLCGEAHRRTWLADQLADYFGFAPHRISAYSGRDKGFKQIHLAVRDRNGTEIALPESVLKDRWYVKVFIANEEDVRLRQKRVKRVMDELIHTTPPDA